MQPGFSACTSDLTQKGPGPAFICGSGRPAGDQQLGLFNYVPSWWSSCCFPWHLRTADTKGFGFMYLNLGDTNISVVNQFWKGEMGKVGSVYRRHFITTSQTRLIVGSGGAGIFLFEGDAQGAESFQAGAQLQGRQWSFAHRKPAGLVALECGQS